MAFPAFLIINAVHRDAEFAAATFKMGVVVEVVCGFTLRLRQRDTQLGCNLRDQFHRQFKVVEHVGPKVQPPTDTQTAAELPNIRLRENPPFAMPLFPPGIGEIDMYRLQRSAGDARRDGSAGGNISLGFRWREQRCGVSGQHHGVGTVAPGQSRGSMRGVLSGDLDAKVIVLATAIRRRLDEQPLATADFNLQRQIVTKQRIAGQHRGELLGRF